MTMSQPHWKTALATALCVVACSQPGLAQTPPTTILEIDVENVVNYFYDTFDISKYAKNPGVTTASTPDFSEAVSFTDIVAVNGQPARGTSVAILRSIFLATDLTPGMAIADMVRKAFNQVTFEILSNDGAPIGSLFISA